MRIFATHLEWLDYYYEQYGSYRVQLFQHRPFKWVNYESEEYHEFFDDAGCLPNHREKMLDELVIDVDGERKDNKKLMDRLVEKFTDDELTFYGWQSGGEGYHLHLFYPELRTKNKRDRLILLRLLKTHITKGVSRPKDLKSHVCGANPKLIQCEKALHRKGGYKELYSKQELGVNKIPFELYMELQRILSQPVKETWNYFNGDTPSHIKFFLKGENFISIGDGRYRAMFCIASHYVKIGLDREEVYLKLKEWNDYQLRGYFEDYRIRNVATTTNGSVGMRFVKDLLRELDRLDILES